MDKILNKTLILKTIVGSQAHGLATKDSDFDYRGVFVIPTSHLLRLEGWKNPQTMWIEGNNDDTSWEVGKFLNMAVHCNPTVLETFLAPTVESERPLWGDEMQQLFQYVWNSKDVMNAFIGYGVNQRTKFFADKDGRAPKYATAYLRTLFQAQELLTTGTFTVRVADTEIGETLKKFKRGEFTQGEVIQACFEMEIRLIKAFKQNPDKQTNLEPINEFLLKVRKEFWE